MRVAIPALFLFGICNAATAAPTFADSEINAQLQRIDIAGIHYGDTVEQVHAKLGQTGWKLEAVPFDQDSFNDAVLRQISKMKGLRFVNKSRRVPSLENYRKGAQTLEVNYRTHSSGTLVTRIVYTHNAVTSRPTYEAFEKEAHLKFSKSPLVRANSEDYCLPADARCMKAARNGGGTSDFPSVTVMLHHQAMVILHEGDRAKRLFDDALAAAVAKARGPLDTSF